MFWFGVAITLLIIGIVKTDLYLMIASGLFAIASSIFWSVLVLSSKFKEKDGEKK